MAVTPDGTLYVNSWTGRYFRNAPPAPGGGLVIALKDRNGDGVADVTERFGTVEAQGGHGGDGLALWHGALYVEEHDTIVRYALRPGQMAPVGPATGALRSALVGRPSDAPVRHHGGHVAGQLRFRVNTCESPNRQPGAKGQTPASRRKRAPVSGPIARTS
jgi:hypothetical protein